MPCFGKIRWDDDQGYPQLTHLPHRFIGPTCIKNQIHIYSWQGANIISGANRMDVYDLGAYLQELTAHQLKIVQAIYNSGGKWLTRSKVARSLGKRRLTPYDINCLKMLTDKGIINTSTQPTTAPGSDFAYIYNMPDEVADLIQAWSEMNESVTRVHKRKPINLVSE